MFLDQSFRSPITFSDIGGRRFKRHYIVATELKDVLAQSFPGLVEADVAEAVSFELVIVLGSGLVLVQRVEESEICLRMKTLDFAVKSSRNTMVQR